MKDAKALPTPMVATTSLSAHQGSPFENPSPYRNIVAGLQYLCIIGLDFSFSLNMVCQFMVNLLDTQPRGYCAMYKILFQMS